MQNVSQAKDDEAAELRAELLAKRTFQDMTAAASPRRDTRTADVSAFADILREDEAGDLDGEDDDQQTERFVFVPKEVMGRVIGRNHSNINRIGDETETFITPSRKNDSQKLCLIEVVGTRRNCARAEELIMAIVEGRQPKPFAVRGARTNVNTGRRGVTGRGSLLRQAAPSDRDGDEMRCFIFVDSSNIFIGAQRSAATGRQDYNIRLNIPKLVEVMECGRRVEERLVGGSEGNSPMDGVWRAWEDCNYNLAISKRQGGEMFVDDMIHGQIMNSILQRSVMEGDESPKTLVIASGDGNLNDDRSTFPRCCEFALKLGWWVEIVAWRESCSNAFFDVKRRDPNGDKMSIIFLDDYRADITTRLPGSDPPAPVFPQYQSNFEGGGGGAGGDNRRKRSSSKSGGSNNRRKRRSSKGGASNNRRKRRSSKGGGGGGPGGRPQPSAGARNATAYASDPTHAQLAGIRFPSLNNRGGGGRGRDSGAQSP